MPQPVNLALDRSILVPKDKIIKTGYVEVFNCILACRDRISVGDIDRAYQKVLQNGDGHIWPCPSGEWNDQRFIIHDGRHEWLASVALGKTHILVAWLEEV